MKLYERLTKIREKKEGKKGFTLVELIVVLVILAILAAILVPALLGYVDKARKSQYELEAKSVYMAMQSQASELYAQSSAATGTSTAILKGTDFDTTDLMSTADVTGLSINTITLKGTDIGTHDSYTLTGVNVTFTSSKGKVVTCELKGGVWTCTEGAYVEP